MDFIQTDEVNESCDNILIFKVTILDSIVIQTRIRFYEKISFPVPMFKNRLFVRFHIIDQLEKKKHKTRGRKLTNFLHYTKQIKYRLVCVKVGLIQWIWAYSEPGSDLWFFDTLLFTVLLV